MSGWVVAIGGVWIALGVHRTWQDSRILFFRRYWRGDLSKAERRTRRTALTKLRRSLLYIALGLIWVTGWYRQPITDWLLGGYLVVLVAYDVSAWRRSRKTRSPGRQTA
jgi:hypothetical protein